MSISQDKGSPRRTKNHDLIIIKQQLLEKYGQLNEKKINQVLLSIINQGSSNLINVDDVENIYLGKKKLNEFQKINKISNNEKSTTISPDGEKTVTTTAKQQRSMSPYILNTLPNEDKNYPKILTPLKSKKPDIIISQRNNIIQKSMISNVPLKQLEIKTNRYNNNNNTQLLKDPLFIQKNNCSPFSANTNKTPVNSTKLPQYCINQDEFTSLSKQSPSGFNNQQQQSFDNGIADSSFCIAPQRHKKNLTMWDMIALQDTVKAKLEAENQRLQTKKNQYEMKVSLQNQVQTKNLDSQMQAEFKQIEKEDLDKNTFLKTEQEKMLKQDKFQRLREISLENANNFQNLMRMTMQSHHEVKESLMSDFKRSNQKLNQVQQQDMQKQKSSKERLKNLHLKDIQEKQKSQSELKQLDYLNSVKAVHDQLQFFQNRDKKLTDFQQKIEDRDTKLYNYFAKPDVVTYTKLENIKTQKVDQKAAEYAIEIKQREIQKEAEKMKHVIDKYIEDQQQLIKKSSFDARSSMSKLSKQALIQDYQESVDKKNKEYLRQVKLKTELDKQVQEKAQLKTQERLYLDEKQLATNSKIIRSISPEVLMKVKGQQRADDLQNDTINMESQIQMLNLMIN